MRPGRLLLLALTLAMAPTASAAMGQFHGTAALPWVVEGEHAARSDDGAFLLRGDIGDTDLAMSAEAGRLTRIVTRAYAMASHDDPRAEVLWGGRVDTHELPLAGATLRLAARQPSFVALLHEGPVQLHGGADGALALDLVGERLEVRHEPSAALRIQVDPAGAPFAKSFPASWLKQASSAGVASLASGSAMLTGGTFVLEAADGKRHEFEAFRRTEERPGSIYNPLTRTWSGPGTHRELVDERLVLEGFRGRLDVAFTGIQGLLLAPRADIDVLGTLTLPGARGQVSLEDGENVHTHELAGTTLQLDGRFVARSEQPDAAAGRARLTATGDIRTVP
ncbi:MAG TPA: hypothetical protein VFH47_03995 [Candidatus Thermoplasmatota archaeon]|nr:hypothetical protein [Candidatus Thermoplasmatota archaeon]